PPGRRRSGAMGPNEPFAAVPRPCSNWGRPGTWWPRRRWSLTRRMASRSSIWTRRRSRGTTGGRAPGPRPPRDQARGGSALAGVDRPGLLQPCQRFGGLLAPEMDLEVQVGAGGVAVVADGGDDVAGLDLLPLGDVDVLAVHVHVPALHDGAVDLVLDDDQLAGASVDSRAGVGDDAVGDRVDRGAQRRREVGAGVHRA